MSDIVPIPYNPKTTASGEKPQSPDPCDDERAVKISLVVARIGEAVKTRRVED